MKALLVFTALGFVLGQIVYYHPELVHGYSMEYHSYADIIVVRNATTCYIVDVTAAIETDLRHSTTRRTIEEEIYNQMVSHKGEVVSSIDKIRQQLQDIRAIVECFNHNVYQIKYMHSTSKSI
ncbi:uncharacterized protein LOC124262821 isoform X2 [Haliotis rubra]|uniref:uncharacterized protein LOC124262821 isoform X2 n=1 Tax=Haliotis rubra TaxID=36100 RepID=UPI001EE59F74|nr:uncharacterized protein LOC124262821 isoform X2 [Haliotis rubra]